MKVDNRRSCPVRNVYRCRFDYIVVNSYEDFLNLLPWVNTCRVVADRDSRKPRACVLGFNRVKSLHYFLYLRSFLQTNSRVSYSAVMRKLLIKILAGCILCMPLFSITPLKADPAELTEADLALAAEQAAAQGKEVVSVTKTGEVVGGFVIGAFTTITYSFTITITFADGGTMTIQYFVTQRVPTPGYDENYH